jgi:hypothetical protein
LGYIFLANCEIKIDFISEKFFLFEKLRGAFCGLRSLYLAELDKKFISWDFKKYTDTELSVFSKKFDSFL